MAAGPAQPWRDPDALRALAARWRQQWAGRPVLRVDGGPGWAHLTLGGARSEPGAHLLLAAVPAAVLPWDGPQPPPAFVGDVLGRHRRSPLAPHLAGARLLDARVPPADRILALDFAPRGGGPPLRLLHQLYGGRGNLMLLAADGRLLWSQYPAPHPSLLPRLSPSDPEDDAARDAAVRAPPSAAGDSLRAAAMLHLETVLRRLLAARLARALKQAVAATERRRERLSADLAAAGRGDELRRAAETLAAGLAQVPRGASSVTLPDPRGGMLEIPLDPALSPAGNLDELFRRARRADRGREVAAARLAAARQRLAQLAAAQQRLEALAAQPGEGLDAYLRWRAETAPLLERAAPLVETTTARAAPEPGRPFRRYLIDGRWEVWVGRDDQENDLLTQRASAPDDWWLHAQGVPGSHVVLRAAGRPADVPRAVIAKAACLAALHSRARHASLVPVVCALRKHVRKPRRSPPGTAVCGRERTLFAVPQVPPGAAAV